MHRLSKETTLRTAYTNRNSRNTLHDGGTDLFDFESKTYSLTVDIYSKIIEVDWLQDLGSKATIEALKAHFSRHGISEVTEVRSLLLRICKSLQRIR